jgi:hypothetical protein
MTSEFQWHTQPFTMEAWVYPTTFSIHTDPNLTAIMGNSGYDGWGYYNFGFNNEGKITFHYYYDNSTSLTAVVKEATASGVINRWQHIAMTHNSGTIKLYVNGVEKVSASVVGTPGYNFGNQRQFQIGNYFYSYKGYMDEIRVSSAVRYTSNFTPSNQPFVNDANTILLIHGDDTNQYVSATACVADDGGELNITPSGFYGYISDALDTNASTLNPKQISVVGHSTGDIIRSIYISQPTGDFTNYITPLLWNSTTKTFTKGTPVSVGATTTNSMWGRKVVSENSYKTNSINETAYAVSYIPQSASQLYPMMINSAGAITLGTPVATQTTGFGTVAEHADLDFDNFYTNPTYVWWGRVESVGPSNNLVFTRNENTLTRVALTNFGAWGPSNRAGVIGSGSTVGQANSLQIDGQTPRAAASGVGTTGSYTTSAENLGFTSGKAVALLLSSTSNTSKYVVYGRDATNYFAKIINVTWTNNNYPTITVIADQFIEDTLANKSLISGYEFRLVKGWQPNSFFLFYINSSNANGALYVKPGIVNGNRLAFSDAINLGPINANGNAVSFDLDDIYIDDKKYFVGLASTSAFEGSVGNLGHFAIDASAYSFPSAVITASNTAPLEGTSVEFNILTTGIAQNTTLYYTIEQVAGNVSQTDFSQSITGSTQVGSDGRASVTLTLAADADITNDSFRFVIRSNSTSGPILAKSPIVTIINPVTSVTRFTTFNRSFATFTIPTNIQANDLAVLYDFSTSNSPAVPSGWTQISSVGVTGARTVISYKVLTASDAGVIFTGMSTGTLRKAIAIYRGNVPINTVAVTVTGQQATSAKPANQSLVGEAGPVITLAVYGSTGGYSTDSTGTSQYNNVATSGVIIRETITNSGTPATRTITMTDGGINTLQTFRFRIR